MNEVRIDSGFVRWTCLGEYARVKVPPPTIGDFVMFRRLGYRNKGLAIVSYFKPTGDIGEVSVLSLTLVETHEP